MENLKHPGGRIAFRLFRAGVLLLLISRAWQYLYWESPLRAVVWDEKLFAPIARRMGWTWADWVSSPKAASFIDYWSWGLGAALLAGVLGALLLRAYPRSARVLLIIGGLVCLLHALLTTKAHFGRFGHFIELSLQWMSPFLLVYLASPRFHLPKLLFFAKLAIALTFVGHGLYAWGYYPVPGNFQQMMLSGFGVDNQQALLLLQVAGLLDFVAAGLLFFPYGKLFKLGLGYIITWGFLTAAARIWAHLELSSTADILLRWLPEFGVRGVHFLVPLAVYRYESLKNSTLEIERT